MKTPYASEKGQALIFLVLGMVVFLGFVALAIDGSMVYSDRRRAQNGADAASLAGGGAAALSLANDAVSDPGATYPGWNCAAPAIASAQSIAVGAAIDRANKNNFVINDDISDHNGVTTECGVFDNGSWVDKYIDVSTAISTTTQTSFLEVVYNRVIQNRVNAVTRVRPTTPLAYGNAIVALRHECPNSNTGGVHFLGGGGDDVDVHVTGGGIFSNACFVATGNTQVVVEPVGQRNVCIGNSCYTESGGADVTPTPITGGPQIQPAMYIVPEPNCGALPDHGNYNGGGTISPGRYDSITLHNGDLVMEPGLYCITEGDFQANGGSVTGSDVTIFIEADAGDFDTNGNVNIRIAAPPANNCETPCTDFGAIPGVLIYLAEGNNGEVNLLGTSDSDYFGIVYAPTGIINAGGTGSLMGAIHTQLIGDTVFVHGNTVIDINYDLNNQKWKPVMIDLFK